MTKTERDVMRKAYTTAKKLTKAELAILRAIAIREFEQDQKKRRTCRTTR